MGFNIAIDGPAGAGKSTIAKKVAKELSFIYVDTGAMYRAIALYVLEQGIDIRNEEKVSACCETADVTIVYEDQEQQVLLNGTNVNGKIRTEEVGNTASVISVYQAVRKKLVELQQKLAASADVIMDGRDIGTCVLPNAPVKIYLTASVATRAERRYKELTQKGVECDMAEIARDIEERDARDMNREISPLRQAEDAVLVDSSEMNIQQVVERILGIAAEKR